MSKKILIAEDDPGIQLSLKDEFESEGYQVFTANDGKKGLEMIKEKKPDLIILDIMLPELDGYEVCKKLRREGDNTPIIMLTVKDQEIDKVLGLPVDKRLYPGVALEVLAVWKGAAIVRCHEVVETLEAIRMCQAVRDVV